VGKSDVLRWQEQMRQAGLTQETIQQRLAAVSSFYAFVCASYTTYGPDGREQPLADYNPVAGVPRPRISQYNKSTSGAPLDFSAPSAMSSKRRPDRARLQFMPHQRSRLSHHPHCRNFRPGPAACQECQFLALRILRVWFA
jgi:hypothetical protein